METLTRMVLVFMASALTISIVVAQEEAVTVMDTTPPVESSIAENEEITETPQQTDTKSVAETTAPPAEDPVSFQGSQRLQTQGGEESASNSESNSENSESLNVETMQGGPVLDIPAQSVESKEEQDPESEESFTLPAGK